MCKNEYWTKMGIHPPPLPPLQTESCSKSYESTDYRESHEGGLPNKVDMQQVQNVGQTKCLTENLMPMQKSALRPNDWASFHEN